MEKAAREDDGWVEADCVGSPDRSIGLFSRPVRR